jgi:hypothetical protein
MDQAGDGGAIRLEAIGLGLRGAGAPIVVCTVEWTGPLTGAHRAWCGGLVEAGRTSPDRVARHCVHPYNAPLVCPAAAALVAQQPDLPRVFDADFLPR